MPTRADLLCYIDRAVDHKTCKPCKHPRLSTGGAGRDTIGSIPTVNVVKVLGVYFSSAGVASTTWQKALERANQAVERLQQLDLRLREKALAVKTTVCSFANYASRVAVIPRKTANQLNKLINALLWDGKPAPVKRNLLQLPECNGGLGLPHVLTTSKMLALKTARHLHQATDYIGKSLLLHWCSTSTDCLVADRHSGPKAESPSPFYKAVCNTKRMLDMEAPSCDIDKDPPACIVEVLTLNQLSTQETRRIDGLKPGKMKQRRSHPREVHDFE
ncbi:hypothetical protein HPB50_018355 [Hyalomma asiaticum]|uniref:Uncharacterized protein n=1 Tax=Hyalomma asiaticum TaxID=266040 RepID=A0ACB7T8K9_HYAAI|nr:hypothetical protein HPB50_018355 [Hyalomma asiaticum]